MRTFIAGLVLCAALLGTGCAPDSDERLLITLSASVGGTNAEGLCLASAPTLLGGLTSRRSIWLQNLGPNAIYLCPKSAGCTTGTGVRLSSGDDRAMDWRESIPVYCIAATADQTAAAGTRYIEVR